MGVVIWDLGDASVSASFMQVTAVCFDMSCAITEDTLRELGAVFHGVSFTCTPLTGGIFVPRAVLPSIGKIGDACIEYCTGDVGRDGGIMKDAWLELSVGIGTSQRMEGVILVPLCVPIKLFKLCQVFGEVHHPLMGVTESLDFSL